MKKLFIPLGLLLIGVAGICLVSWVSQINTAQWPDYMVDQMHNRVTPPWVLMDPPCMSLYLSVPGFFVSLVGAIVSLGHAS